MLLQTFLTSAPSLAQCYFSRAGKNDGKASPPKRPFLFLSKALPLIAAAPAAMLQEDTFSRALKCSDETLLRSAALCNPQLVPRE